MCVRFLKMKLKLYDLKILLAVYLNRFYLSVMLCIPRYITSRYVTHLDVSPEVLLLTTHLK